MARLHTITPPHLPPRTPAGDQPADTRLCAAQGSRGSWGPVCAECQVVNIPCRNIIVANNLIYNPTWYARVSRATARAAVEARGTKAVRCTSS